MAIDNFEYTHPNGWEDSVNFPTTPANETQTRQLLQQQHKEVRNYLKDKLVPGVNAHLAESVAQRITATRDVSIAGIQTIATNFRPKQIDVIAFVAGEKRVSWGNWSISGGQRVMVLIPDIGVFTIGDNTSIYLREGNNHVIGTVQNIQNNSFEINWVKNLGSPTGTATLHIVVRGHGI